MSWHAYDRHRRNWTIYWEERPPANPALYPGHAEGEMDLIEFELTEPYALNREEWNALQLKILLRLTPPDHTLNISQLWTRVWPVDGALRFNKLTDIYHLPVVLSAAADHDEQPGKREDYYWVLTQLAPDPERLADIVAFQNVDLENITWITKEPVAPWPSQLFLYNEPVLAWQSKLLSREDFDELVRRECWALLVTHLGHVYLRTTRGRRSPEAIFEILREEAANFDLEIESTTFDKRPQKPGLLKSLGALPGNVIQDGWEQLKTRNKRRP
jgi:hypothetical protein